MFTSELITSYTTIGIGVLLVIIVVLFFLTLQNTLQAIEPQNRTMKPGKIWLLFIPIFNLFWLFTVIKAIATSAGKQLDQYGVITDGKPTYSLGLTWAICSICNRLPAIGVFFAFMSLVLFVLYWVKVSLLKKQILSLREIYQNKDTDSIL